MTHFVGRTLMFGQKKIMKKKARKKMGLMKRIFEKLRQRKLERYKRMHSEVLCSILYDTMREQTKEGINIPTFMLVNQRYNKLRITCPKDLERVYTEFFLQGKVSGIEL